MEFDSPLASILLHAMNADYTVVEFRVEGDGDDALLTAMDITDHHLALEEMSEAGGFHAEGDAE